jgi:hypothetical protein
MASTSPVLGLVVPDDDSPNDPPLHFGAWSKVLDGTVPRAFANAADRDAAFAAFVAAGGVMNDGMYAHMNDDGRLWRYKGSAWAWPRWAMGEIGYVSRTSQAGPASTLGTWVPVSGLALSFTLPSARKVKLTWSGQLFSDQAGTEVLVRINDTTTSKQKFCTATVNFANYGVGTTAVMRESLAAGTYSVQIDIMRLAGPGSAFLTADLAELIVEDMGASA